MKNVLPVSLGALAALCAAPAFAWPPSWIADSATGNVYRTTDQGATWPLMGQYRGASPGTNVHIGMTVNGSAHLYVAESWVTGTTDDFEVYKSTDQGATWAATNPPAPNDLGTGNYWYQPSIGCDMNNRIMVVLLMNAAGSFCPGAADRSRTFLTTDGGATWSYVGVPLVGTTAVLGYYMNGGQNPNAGWGGLAGRTSGNFILGGNMGHSNSSSCTSTSGSSSWCTSWDQGATWTSGIPNFTRALAVDLYDGVYRFFQSSGPTTGVTYNGAGGWIVPVNFQYPFAAGTDNLGVVYCASAYSGWCYKSLNFGETWTPSGQWTTASLSAASIAFAGDSGIAPPLASSPTPTPAAAITTVTKSDRALAFRSFPNPAREGEVGFAFPPCERAVIAIFDAAGDRVAIVPAASVDAASGTARWTTRTARGAYAAVLVSERGRAIVRFAIAR